MKLDINRRTVLRGLLGGTAVSVGLPMLDVFLNSNATALADGAPIPLTFVSWFQGLGFPPGYWEPKTIGKDYEFGHAMRAMKELRAKTTLVSGSKVYRDGHPAGAHTTGPEAILQGGVSDPNLPSIDQIIADFIGTRTRFRSLEVSCDGTQESLSRRSASAINPSEPSPVSLYTRIFGPEFKDPNAADFTPDPRVMARASVLSGIKDRRDDLTQQLGAVDKARLDEYFTSLRELEKRLALQLEKPEPLPACTIPNKVDHEAPLGVVVDDARANNKLHAQLIAHAMACGQTQVASLNFGGATSNLRQPGSQQTFHMYSHEEAVDPALGYQKNFEVFSNQVAESLVDFVKAFDSVREGDKTLLDRSVIFYSTDVGFARTHGLDNIPMMIIGNAGGRLKPGYHIAANGDTVTRAGLTVMQALSVPVGAWGSESNRTSKPFTEILA